MKSGRVLTQAGNNVVIRTKNDKEDQIFVLNSKTQTIEPYKNQKLSLDIADWGHNRYATFSQTKSIWHQKFNLNGEYLVNERGLVLDVQGARDKQNQSVLVWKRHSGVHQKWKADYV